MAVAPPVIPPINGTLNPDVVKLLGHVLSDLDALLLQRYFWDELPAYIEAEEIPMEIEWMLLLQHMRMDVVGQPRLNSEMFRQYLAKPEQWPLIYRLMIGLENYDISVTELLLETDLEYLAPEEKTLLLNFRAANDQSGMNLGIAGLVAAAHICK